MNNNVKLRAAVVFLWDREAKPCLGKNTPSMTVIEERSASCYTTDADSGID